MAETDYEHDPDPEEAGWDDPEQASDEPDDLDDLDLNELHDDDGYPDEEEES